MPKLFLLILVLFAIGWGCYEEQEGCLDPMATNYDVSADINANCQYPSFSFSVDHRWGDDLFSMDSFYTDAAGNSFQILFFGLFVRDIEVDTGMGWVLLNASKQEWSLINNANLEASDPIGFIQARNFENSWGELDYFGVFDSVRMQLGLGPLEDVDPNLLREDHPLNQNSQMYDTTNQSYYGWVLRYRADTASGTPIHQVSSTKGQRISWSQQATGDIMTAENKSFIFELNYELLFGNFRIDNLPFNNRSAINENWSTALILRES